VAWTEANRRLIEVGFFGAVILAGVASYVRYIETGDPFLLTYNDRYYGAVLEVPLVLLERGLALTDEREIYLMRHLAMYGLFVAGVGVFYALTLERFDWRLGLVGCVFLVVSPRIFAHSFFNSKDMGFLVMFTAAMWSLTRFYRVRRWQNLVLHGVVSALLIGTRIVGLVAIGLTGMMLALDWASGKRNLQDGLERVGQGLWYGAVTVATLKLVWPILWRDAWPQLTEAVREMAAFPLEVGVLYFGRYYQAGQLPWHYVLGWMAISIPLLYLGLLGAGVVRLVVEMKRSEWQWEKRWFEVLSWLWLVVPVGLIVALRATVYDGWRQMFFVYPALLLIGLSGLEWWGREANKKWPGEERREDPLGHDGGNRQLLFGSRVHDDQDAPAPTGVF
jgi:4-amino-4-deoxy-L-arabinose transferase-like glycosyltransferase